jgi:hypothetical protein
MSVPAAVLRKRRVTDPNVQMLPAELVPPAPRRIRAPAVPVRAAALPPPLPVVVDDGTDPLPLAPAAPGRGRELLTNALEVIGGAINGADGQATAEGQPLGVRHLAVNAAKIIAPPAPTTRARVADPLKYSSDRLMQMELEGAPEDKNGRWKSAGLGVLRGFAQGGLGGALTGGIIGAVKPGWDEATAYDAELERQRGIVSRVGAISKGQLDREGQRADIELKKIKPALETEKLSLKRAYDRWRIQSGNRKQDSAEAYKDFMMELGDRRALTAEGRLQLAREWQGIQQEQFGQTINQRERFEGGRNDDRDAQREQRQRQFDQTFGLNLDRFEETKRRGLTGDSLKTFGVATKGRVERLRAIHTEIERWNKRKGENTTRPETANENISELQSEALQLSDQIEAAREAALAGVAAPAAAGGGVAAPRVPAPSLARPVRRSMPGARVPSAAAAQPVTEDAIRARARAVGKNEDAAVAAARSRGMIQ